MPPALTNLADGILQSLDRLLHYSRLSHVLMFKLMLNHVKVEKFDLWRRFIMPEDQRFQQAFVDISFFSLCDKNLCIDSVRGRSICSSAVRRSSETKIKLAATKP